MKKILFVMHSLDFGGAERSLVNLLCELPQERCRVDVLLLQRQGAFLTQLPDWVRVLDTPDALHRLYGPVSKAGIYAVPKVAGTLCARLLRRTRKARSAWRWRNVYRRHIPMLAGHYDTAVAFTGSEILYYVADKVSAGRKLVFIHNDYRSAGYSAADDTPYLARMDAIVSISEQCVQVLREAFPDLSSRMHYLQNITSSALIRRRADEFDPPEYRPGGINLLSVGRLWPQKGFDIAVEAAAILKRGRLNFRWFVVGEGSLRDALQRRSRKAGVEDCFILLGARDNPYPYIRACSLLVQPSRYEGKSVVLDEAKMLCVPIVATAYPTVGDQLLDGQEGLVTEMSPEGIAKGILTLLTDAPLRGRLQTYLARHEYGNQAECAKYMTLLDE